MSAAAADHRHRWLRLAAAFVVMMVIGTYQYSWFLFSFRLQMDVGWDLASLGLVYSTFHYTSTLIMPFSGYVADTYGPRHVASVAALLVGAGFILCAYLPSPWLLIAFYGLGGLGGGVLYGVSTATAVKWFPERRGLASGFAVFGFGAGAAIFNLAIEASLDAYGLERTFLLCGLLMLAVLLPLAQVYRYPAARAGSPSGPGQAAAPARAAEFTPREMLKTHQWYVMYLSFSLTISVVLIFGAQMKLLASHYALPPPYFRALLVLFPLANGLSRVLAGAVADRIGVGPTMRAFYTLLGLTVLGLVWLGDVPILFFLFVIVAALLGGAPFSLYPAAIGAYYGQRYFTTNYGITYTAKAWAGLIAGWLSGYLVVRFGSFTVPLIAIAVCSLIAAVASHPRLLSAPAPAARLG